ncbi:MAG: TVP38/TMEM64 family protein [Nitrospirae bacterium]|nr:TVP38/TMEM64 family protein [Nitrospirota bacterium]
MMTNEPKRHTPGMRTWFAVAVATSLLGLRWGFDLLHYWSLERLVYERDFLLAFTHMHYVQAVALFIALYIVGAALSLPGDVLLTIAGGFLFGSVVGTLYVNIGATIGATLAFLAARYWLRDWVDARFGRRLKGFQDGFAKNAFSYLLTLRLIPAVPFVLVNLVSGLTRVDLGTYVRASALGMLPGSFVFAYAGQELSMIPSPGEILTPPVLLAFGLLALLSLMPALYRYLTEARATHRKATMMDPSLRRETLRSLF